MVQIDLLSTELIRRMMSVLLFKRSGSEGGATERGISLENAGSFVLHHDAEIASSASSLTRRVRVESAGRVSNLLRAVVFLLL